MIDGSSSEPFARYYPVVVCTPDVLAKDRLGRQQPRSAKILLEIYSGFSMEIRRQGEQPSEAVVEGRIPFCERPTCSINEACRAVGFGRTKLYDLIDEGLVETIKIGRRRFVRVPSLLAFLGRRQ